MAALPGATWMLLSLPYAWYLFANGSLIFCHRGQDEKQHFQDSVRWLSRRDSSLGASPFPVLLRQYISYQSVRIDS